MNQKEFFGISDIGLQRENNEDVWIAIPEHNFYAIADGMGGHLAGEVAAQETIEHISNTITKLKSKDCVELIIELKAAIELANHWVYSLSKKNANLKGMGTTLCCMLWTKTNVIYAHVGDSRIYRFRDKKLELLTQDHSLYSKWLKTYKNSKTPFPYKNVITRAVGTSSKANPEIASTPLLPGDLFFLCTDGLSDVLKLDEIETTLNETSDLEEATKKLICQAKLKGSSDNITILMIQSERQGDENIPGQQRYNSARS